MIDTIEEIVVTDYAKVKDDPVDKVRLRLSVTVSDEPEIMRKLRDAIMSCYEDHSFDDLAERLFRRGVEGL